MTRQAPIDIDGLAVAWIALRHAKEGSPEHDALFWAHSVFWRLCREDPQEAWDAILAVLSKGSDARVLGDLAAGPLEDLLVYHGPAVIAHVEEMAKKDAAVAAMLGGVWKNDIDDEVWSRVEALRSHVW